jgi:hypothetical protein
VGVPFGGTGSRGYGREHAQETLREYGFSKSGVRLQPSLRIPNGMDAMPRWSLSLGVTADVNPDTK